MFFRHLKNVLSRQDNSKTNLRCLEDVLRRLGIIFVSVILKKKNLSLFVIICVVAKFPKIYFQ